jgi:hypothetical protein
MSIWKYAGAALGALPGIVTLNPALAVTGGAAGYGMGASADASNESADAAANANAAAAGVTAPQINPNAGIGTNWGGTTPGERATAAADAQARDLASQQLNAAKDNYQALLKAYQAHPTPAGAAAVRAASDKADAIGQQYNATIAGINSRKPDMSDPTRFNLQAQESYNRQAPQVSMVQPDMANYGQDRGMFNASGQGLSHQVNQMQTNPVANGQQQQDLVGRLNNDLTGAAPSIAQSQLNLTTQQNIAQQQAMAASAGPMDYAAAQRAAIMGGANAQQNAIGQAALLRANEYQGAEGMLGTVLGQQRGQTLQNYQLQNDVLTQKRAQELQAMGMDADTATKQAQLEAQQRLNNANLQAGQNQLNQGREMGYLGAYQQERQMQQNNQQFNASANLQAQGIKAGLQSNATQAQMQDAASQRQMSGSMINAGAGAYTTYSMGGSKAPNPVVNDNGYGQPASGS